VKKGIGRCTAAIALTVAGGVQAARAQQLTCVRIRPGDTAAHLALHLAGDAAYWREQWFQIVDPATSRSIAKRQYARILPGWRACIDEGLVKRPSEEAPPQTARPLQPPSPDLVQTLTTADFGVWWAVCLVSAAMLVAWRLATYARGRQPVVDIMKIFGERFIREFERPLMRPGSDDRALESRLRFKPRQQRLDILLAPYDGRTYPNLSDHRKNVEYDVGRVLRVLSDERFVGERLFGRGRWVIVRCRFTADPAPVGGR
jgi:hypothetical protein